MLNLDTLITEFDKGLRTLFGPARMTHRYPDEDISEGEMSQEMRRKAAALMRVNHVGEVCAQALYQGQALTARNPVAKQALQQAAAEETEHLAWTSRRISELDGRTSLLNPLWYAGSLAIGIGAGLLGDKWNLGFLAETEHQVCKHLDEHLLRLPQEDLKSRAIIVQMRMDEAQHEQTALNQGAARLPAVVKSLMQLNSSFMTQTSYWI